MPREAVFAVPHDIPVGTRAKIRFKHYLTSYVLPQVGCFGKDGRRVGLGFAWETQTLLAEGNLAFTMTLTRRMQRAFKKVGLLSEFADVYITGAKVTYIRDGEPHARFTLEEK